MAGRPTADSREGTPLEIPDGIYERVSRLCLALPEVTVRIDYSRVRSRSTSHALYVRRRCFCLLIAVEGAGGHPVSQLVLRADPVDCDALRSIGHPFYGTRAGPDRFRVVLTHQTEWEEIRELVTESYRFLAPKKLRALVD